VAAGKCTPGDKSQEGWSYDATPQAVKGPGGLCLDAASASELELAKCDGSDSQKFAFDSSKGTVEHSGKCIDVYNWAGPVVQLFKCNGGTNQKFSFNSDGTLSDATDDASKKHCLAATGTAPGGGGGGTTGMLMWAKKQPAGAQAVLVMNSDAGAHTADIVFAQVNASAHCHVRDVWQRKDLGSFTGYFSTPSLGSHDSGFYLLTPSTTAAVHV
jgi:hypothetical protein